MPGGDRLWCIPVQHLVVASDHRYCPNAARSSTACPGATPSAAFSLDFCPDLSELLRSLARIVSGLPSIKLALSRCKAYLLWLERQISLCVVWSYEFLNVASTQKKRIQPHMPNRPHPSYFWNLKAGVPRSLHFRSESQLLLTFEVVPMDSIVWVFRDVDQSIWTRKSAATVLSHPVEGDAPWFKPALRA